MTETPEVLIVEDDENMRTLLSHFMEREDMETILHEDGQSAEDYISEHSPPDIALVDLHLPYVDGFELINTIRNTDHWQDIPIMVISSEDTDKSVEKALSMGADDYVEKPVEMKKTMARVNRFLD